MIKRMTVASGLILALAAAAWCGDEPKADRLFLPRHWIRGYLNIEATPGHHEIDLGMCTPPNCTDYARYAWSAYVEVQPFARGFLKSGFLFAEPKLYAGDNQPHANYTLSPALILWEREAGAGWELPRGFQLRVTQHQNFLLGRFARPGLAIIPNGPYGANLRVGVRWNFGGWGGGSE